VLRGSCQKSAAALVDDVFAAVQRFRGDTAPNDDMTVVALKITA
jgi:serine phosphatase RsbU (regulator of sigma subunit)